MIRPVLEYGNVLYDNCSLICTGGYRHTDYNNLLKELHWESLSNRRKLYKLVILYRIVNKTYQNYIHIFLNINLNINYNS